MKSKNLFLIFIFGLFIFLLPSLAEAACSALNYPSNTWQRVWYTYPGGSCLGDGPDESIEQFSNSWGFGTVAWGLSNNIQFTSSRKIYFCVPGDYKFTLNHDDGVRLYVDGSLKLNDWNDGSDH